MIESRLGEYALVLLDDVTNKFTVAQDIVGKFERGTLSECDRALLDGTEASLTSVLFILHMLLLFFCFFSLGNLKLLFCGQVGSHSPRFSIFESTIKFLSVLNTFGVEIFHSITLHQFCNLRSVFVNHVDLYFRGGLVLLWEDPAKKLFLSKLVK